MLNLWVVAAVTYFLYFKALALVAVSIFFQALTDASIFMPALLLLQAT